MAHQELIVSDKSKQGVDADNAFLRLQTQSKVRDRIASETERVAESRVKKYRSAAGVAR